jgi:predicted phosphodiesterase
MKTLVISDIHLTHRFDEKKYLFLESLFSQYDAIILNGDFWDGFSTTFNRFIASKWSRLFPLLKEKKAIYLYGNHDKEVYCDSRTSLFSAYQAHEYSLQEGITTYHFEHGDRYAPGIDAYFPYSWRTFLQFINTSTHIVENIFIRFMGSPQNMFLKMENKKIKKAIKNKQNAWFICGHTHYAEFDEKRKFANSGFIQYGKATYLSIDSSGIELKKERYK